VAYHNGSTEAALFFPGENLPTCGKGEKVTIAMHQGEDDTTYAIVTGATDEQGITTISFEDTEVRRDTADNVKQDRVPFS
jgi:hypothetical protein